MRDTTGLIKSSAFSIGFTPVEARKHSDKGGVKLSKNNAGGAFRDVRTGLWLERAAEKYHLSGDINDYILVPVPAIVTSIPNTNGDSVSLHELTQFMPEYGTLSYQTWVGKPCFVEHQHNDITKAKGIILDTYMVPIKAAPQYAKLVFLQAYDRTKDSALTENILSERVDTYSMGLWYSSYRCSICNAHVGKGIGAPCAHTRPGRSVYQMPDGKLAYRKCEAVVGFENSCVVDPAYAQAQSNIIWDVRKL